MTKSTLIIIALFVLVAFNRCNLKGKVPVETPTRGHIKIAVDESYNLIVDAEKQTFEAFYPYAKINISYENEFDAFRDFINDSVRLIIVNKKLTTEQENYLKSKQYIPRTTLIAHDALAFIINRSNPDSSILYDHFRDIFTGKINRWKQINPHSELGTLNVVFDNEKSGNVRYIKEKFEINQKFPANCFAVKNNDEVIKYVEQNPNALGVIGVNWISDKHDSVSKGFLDRVRVVEVGDIGNTDGSGDYYKPYAAYIANGSYPFIRDVYIISRETFSGLGTGFASFIAGDQGQRIVLKDGLVPGTMPVRLIEIKKK